MSTGAGPAPGAPAAEADLSAPRRRRGIWFVLSVGAVSWAWSEVGFWARFRADDKAAVWVLTWLLYSLVAYLILRLLRRFPVSSPAVLVMVGATYGWLVEGTVANTVYLTLPVSIVWTALAWHALLTMAIGWYALPRVLQRGGIRGWLWCALLGLAWGGWAVGWWAAPPDPGQVAARAQPVSYLLFVTLVSVVAAVGYGVQNSCHPGARDLTGRWPVCVASGLLLLWAVPVVVLPLPWAPVVLGLLLWLALATLRRLTSVERGDAEEELLGWRLGVPWRNLPPLAAVPVVAWCTYVAASPLSGHATGSGPLYAGFVAAIVLLSGTGATLLIWALWSAWSPRARKAHQEYR